MPEINEILEKKLSQGREFRNVMEFRAGESTEEGQMIVEGHFTTFDEEYLLFRWGNYEVWEQIDPHAFEKCDMSDVIMQYDHHGRVFARTRNDTLKISFDDRGGIMRADLSKAADGAGLYNDIQNGLIDRMSFAFTVNKDKRETFEDHETGFIKVVRTITEIGKLYDVSAVSIPANDGTDISARSFSDGVIAELEAERLEAQKKAEARKRLALKLRTLSIR